MRMVNRKIKCCQCQNALGDRNNWTCSPFLALKGCGGLIKPTYSVTRICKETEKRFVRMLRVTNGNLPQCKF